MTSKTILFVDDEANILSGLKRMLRSMRNEMDFYFAESGQDALKLLAEQEINVIVSDMRMPGMDGATLLTTVMEQYPQIIRIMLTGHADDKSILQTIPVVHQFLAKPSDPETLKASTLQGMCTSGIDFQSTAQKSYYRSGKFAESCLRCMQNCMKKQKIRNAI